MSRGFLQKQNPLLSEYDFIHVKSGLLKNFYLKINAKQITRCKFCLKVSRLHRYKGIIFESQISRTILLWFNYLSFGLVFGLWFRYDLEFSQR